MPNGPDDRPRPVRAYARPQSQTSRRVDEWLTRLDALLVKIDKEFGDFRLTQSNAMTELKTKLGFSDAEQKSLRDRMDGIESAQRKQTEHDRKVLFKALLAAIGGGASVAGASQILKALVSG